MYLNLTEQEHDHHIYRIISIDRLFELFDKKENVLVKPKMWEDPFENMILKSKVRYDSGETVQFNFHNRLYGQCWSLNKASDAMWRIYSPSGNGVRIRTSIKKIFRSIVEIRGEPQFACAIGKVSYLPTKKIFSRALSTFDHDGISHEKLFMSLLYKRTAFKHENEVRLLYFEFNNSNIENDLYRYKINAHQLIDQIMVDPRLTEKKAKEVIGEIRTNTHFEGPIKRSLLYAFPDILTVDVHEPPA